MGKTDAGLVRSHNEDQFLVAQLERALVLEQSGFPITPGERRLDNSGRLLMVADGMGGHEAGELASNLVIDAMAHYAFAVMPWLGTHAQGDAAAIATGLRSAAEGAQQRLREVARRKGLSTNLGTTLTMAYIRWPECLLVHVGDSRAYLLRSGELFRLTKDHNLAQSMVQRGAMTADEARLSRFSSVLTNALGGTSDDLHVELHHFDLLAGDRLLLCTDGLYSELSEAEMALALASCILPELAGQCVEHLIEHAKLAGGRDNITAILAVF